MKNINYVLVVVILLLISCGGEDDINVQNERAYYRTLNANLDRQGVYATMSTGEQYKFSNIDYEPTSFRVGDTYNDTTELFIDGTVEFCRKYVGEDIDPIPFGRYRLRLDSLLPINYDWNDRFNLDGVVAEINENGVTFDGNPSTDLIHKLEYNHEGVDYLIEKGGKNSQGYYTLWFVKKGEWSSSTPVLEKID